MKSWIVSLPLTLALGRACERALFAGAVAVVACGCTAKYIPNTDVPDTPENRDIIEFCELYRKAVERKDVVMILKLTSPDYYEDGGNPDASDDMDFVQFKKFLTGESRDETGISFQDATAIRHEIRYRRVLYEDKRIFVDYTYSASFRVPTAHGDQWKRKVDDNRIELIQEENGVLRVIAGF
jgi:hypothetical protein